MLKIICSTCKTDKVILTKDNNGIELIQCINPECLDFECVTPLYELDSSSIQEVE